MTEASQTKSAPTVEEQPYPAEGQIWRHFKGHTVLVIAVSEHTETGIIEVVYFKPDEAIKKVWHRPLVNHSKAFFQNTEGGVPRFVYVSG